MQATFEEWFSEFTTLAAAHAWPVGDPESYREFYDDGDSPDEALSLEMSYG